jgi:hypothetical protein
MECREMLKDKAVMVRVTSHMAIRHSREPEPLSGSRPGASPPIVGHTKLG